MSGEGEDLSDSRIKAGVLLATAGKGGADLTPFAAEHFPFMNPDFANMTTPALVVAGDKDDLPLSVRGPEWLADPYFLSPGDKSLLTLFGAEHSLGGIAKLRGPGDDGREPPARRTDPAVHVGLPSPCTRHRRRRPGRRRKRPWRRAPPRWAY